MKNGQNSQEIEEIKTSTPSSKLPKLFINPVGYENELYKQFDDEPIFQA